MQSASFSRPALYGCAALVAIGLGLLLRPEVIQTSWARPAGPATLELTGPIRDFRRAHPDFDVVPAEGLGHYAGTVARWLEGTPTPGPAGFQVGLQWTDVSGRNIAPHLENAAPALGGAPPLGIRVQEKIEVKGNAVIDGYNSARGPYGLGGNYGGTAYVCTNSTASGDIHVDKKAVVKANIDVGAGGDPNSVIDGDGSVSGETGALAEAYEMPVPTLPAAEEMAPLIAKLNVLTSQTLVGDTNPDDDTEPLAMHFGEIEIHEDAILTIEGNLILVCDGRFQMRKSQLALAPEASLTLYVGGVFEVKDRSVFGLSDETSGTASVIAVGNSLLRIDRHSHATATIFAPLRKLELNEGHLYGEFVGRQLRLDHYSGIHADAANAQVGAYNFAVTVRETIKLEEVTFDAFDSNDGAYGGANAGLSAILMTNSIKNDKVELKGSIIASDVLVGPGADPDDVIKLDGSTLTGSMGAMPTPATIPVVLPPLVGPSEGTLELVGTTMVLTGARRFKEIKLEGTKLQISGEVILRVDSKFEIKKNSHIELLPGATLALHLEKELAVEDDSSVNLWGNPQNVSVFRTSMKKGKVKVRNNSHISAWIQGAKTEMKVENGTFVGSFAGKKFEASKSTVVVDMAYLQSCISVLDSAGTAGAFSSGGIATAASFRQWFVDQPGANVSRPHTITLTDNGFGVYEYIEPAFLPIDSDMLGNEEDPHNYFFTYELDARFSFEGCTGGFVEFRGGDGCWIYIDGQLVIDIGGVGAVQEQRIDLDRLGLVDGNHRLQLFYAQRSAANTPFELRTNLLLGTISFMPYSMQFD